MSTRHRQSSAVSPCIDPAPCAAESPGTGAALSAIACLPCQRVEVTLEAVDTVCLPGFLGPTLHGALGHAVMADGCAGGCDHRTCAYGRLFVAPKGDAALPRQIAAMSAPPLVVVPPALAEERTLSPGMQFQFAVVLMGRASRETATVVNAAFAMAETGLGRGRGRLSVLRFASTGDESMLAPPATPACGASGPTLNLDIRAVTPLRLAREGRLVAVPCLADLATAAARRLCMAHALHTDGAANWGAVRFDAVAHACGTASVHSEAWELRRGLRWSERQHRRHPLEGVIGHACYLDVPAAIAALLSSGARLGLGKGAALGMGRVELRAGSATPTS